MLSLNFHSAEKRNKHKFLTDNQLRWIEMQKMILNVKDDYEILVPPENLWRNFFHKLVNLKLFEIFIMICILCNIIFMSLNYEGASPSYINVKNKIILI